MFFKLIDMTQFNYGMFDSVFFSIRIVLNQFAMWLSYSWFLFLDCIFDYLLLHTAVNGYWIELSAIVKLGLKLRSRKAAYQDCLGVILVGWLWLIGIEVSEMAVVELMLRLWVKKLRWSSQLEGTLMLIQIKIHNQKDELKQMSGRLVTSQAAIEIFDSFKEIIWSLSSGLFHTSLQSCFELSRLLLVCAVHICAKGGMKEPV